MAPEYRFAKDSTSFKGLNIQRVQKPEPGYGQVLVKIYAASYNFRDLAIVDGMYPLPLENGVVPLSDGAGVVDKIGEGVTAFQVGDRVAPNFNIKHIGGNITPEAVKSGLGGALDGLLREYGVFPETALVKIPNSLSFVQAATLPCAGVTAWNALHGDASHPLRPGQYVLVQGTGGVSIFALQFAIAAGARVIVTSSSDEKIKKAKNLGAYATINYIETPNWSEKVMEITKGRGVDRVVEVGGEHTLMQSVKSLAINGSIAMIGFVAQSGSPVNITEIIGLAISKCASIRANFVGSVEQFREMNECIETNEIKPVVDGKVFNFENAKEGYDYLRSQKHFGKVVVEIAEEKKSREISV